MEQRQRAWKSKRETLNTDTPGGRRKKKEHLGGKPAMSGEHSTLQAELIDDS